MFPFLCFHLSIIYIHSLTLYFRVLTRYFYVLALYFHLLILYSDHLTLNIQNNHHAVLGVPGGDDRDETLPETAAVVGGGDLPVAGAAWGEEELAAVGRASTLSSVHSCDTEGYYTTFHDFDGFQVSWSVNHGEQGRKDLRMLIVM